ncbi:hypothetical protein TTHERM_000393109 (macronuclear) [Tetrahymena thermophila SB210]|uniref:Uncharacterized protein n=1 Tax=Tetrahymena thermophila (strain SB210) TaxID=312017 RepID=W7XF90_TETTS|nr:hypothetical protein TTHERM_000393109 [Tetrahymena thermophila SB210]EWS75488.1 hypothetical protein TTHERM_000393109 [Tetrahymena thermophila SB210]|eukprot:XP_012651957.1 hypothetical protein TTHERM_000393109 [Tetrahymena thermophila SB210]
MMNQSKLRIKYIKALQKINLQNQSFLIISQGNLIIIQNRCTNSNHQNSSLILALENFLMFNQNLIKKKYFWVSLLCRSKIKIQNQFKKTNNNKNNQRKKNIKLKNLMLIQQKIMQRQMQQQKLYSII